MRAGPGRPCRGPPGEQLTRPRREGNGQAGIVVAFAGSVFGLCVWRHLGRANAAADVPQAHLSCGQLWQTSFSSSARHVRDLRERGRVAGKAPGNGFPLGGSSRLTGAMPTPRTEPVLRYVTEEQGQGYLTALVRVFHDDYKADHWDLDRRIFDGTAASGSPSRTAGWRPPARSPRR